jgi:hypothetical protein
MKWCHVQLRAKVRSSLSASSAAEPCANSCHLAAPLRTRMGKRQPPIRRPRLPPLLLRRL